MKSKYLIVLVDDESAIVDYYESIIPDEFDVLKFTCTDKALAAAVSNKERIALVLSDFRMPNGNGLELRENLLAKDVDCPFVLITAFYDKEMAKKGMELKVTCFLEKPINEEQVLEILNNQVRERIGSIEEEREMISEFLRETQPMLEEIEELILVLEENPKDIRAINTYFRLLHTIKGTSSCLGLIEISRFAHCYEDLINKIKSQEVDVNVEIIDILLKGLDELNNLYKIAANFEPFPSNLEELANIFSPNITEISKSPISIKEVETKSISELKLKDYKNKDEKISVSEQLLSDFLEMSGELTVIRNTIFKNLARLQAKISDDADLEHLSGSMVELQKVSSILQNQISEMKKVDIESVYRPMRRVVRDSCKALGKKVEFCIEGNPFKVDTSIAKLLHNVLVHMLRNGIDHGIEDEETRIKNGKEELGKLTLNSYETGENIIVEVIDNGAGLDKNIIKNKALEKGLYTQGQLDEMSDKKIYNIIFESGFSTNSEVTSISGRGVGMDMVKSSMEEHGGKVLTDSKLGEGTKFVLIIPIPRSILIIKSLMVSTHLSHFNIPLDNVAEVILLDHQKDIDCIHKVNGVNILHHHNELFPIVHLGYSLGISKHEEIKDAQNIVIIKGDGHSYGLLVDEIDEIEEIVVKKLSSHFDTPEYIGTTFSDDGELSLILDCKGLAKRNHIDAQVDNEDKEHIINSSVKEDVYEFMRFGLKELRNCAIALDYVYRLEVIDSKSIQYTGDQALIRYLGKSLPLIFIEKKLGFERMSLEEKINSLNCDIHVLVVRIDGRLFGVYINELGDIASTNEKVDLSFSDREGILGVVTIDDKIVTVLNIEEVVGVNCGHLSFNYLDDNIEKNAA